MLKKELRSIYKKKRADLSLNEIQLLSSKTETVLLELLDKLNFNSVNCFLSSNSKKEVHTALIIKKILKQGKAVSVPVSNYENHSIQAVSFNTGTLTTEDKFGIPTPKTIDLIDSKLIDIVIVPLLCFDEKGYRCGYGKGMYDRFLSNCKPDIITIGLSFFDSIPEISDIDKFDVPMNFVVTPEKAINF